MPTSSETWVAGYSHRGYQRKAVVPVAVAKHLGLKNKDKLEWTIKDGKVEVKLRRKQI